MNFIYYLLYIIYYELYSKNKFKMYSYTKKKVKIAYICVEVIIAQKLQRYLIMKYVLYCLERHR